MTDEEPKHEPSSEVRRHRGGHWADVGVSALLVLAVSVPTMVVEEDWDSRPMIDETTHLWIVAACLVSVAFLVGGAVAGYRRPSAAAVHATRSAEIAAAVLLATAAASVAVAVLLVGAVSRRLWITHQSVSFAVARLWLLGVVAALSLSALGSLVGRWLTTATS
jgi:hypothetical protein